MNSFYTKYLKYKKKYSKIKKQVGGMRDEIVNVKDKEITVSFPDTYFCQVTEELFVDPVTTVDGITIERKAIEKWFQTHDTSPVTGAVINKLLIPNHALRNSIEDMKQDAYNKLFPQQIAAPSSGIAAASSSGMAAASSSGMAAASSSGMAAVPSSGMAAVPSSSKSSLLELARNNSEFRSWCKQCQRVQRVTQLSSSDVKQIARLLADGDKFRPILTQEDKNEMSDYLFRVNSFLPEWMRICLQESGMAAGPSSSASAAFPSSRMAAFSSSGMAVVPSSSASADFSSSGASNPFSSSGMAAVPSSEAQVRVDPTLFAPNVAKGLQALARLMPPFKCDKCNKVCEAGSKCERTGAYHMTELASSSKASNPFSSSGMAASSSGMAASSSGIAASSSGIAAGPFAGLNFGHGNLPPKYLKRNIDLSLYNEDLRGNLVLKDPSVECVDTIAFYNTNFGVWSITHPSHPFINKDDLMKRYRVITIKIPKSVVDDRGMWDF